MLQEGGSMDGWCRVIAWELLLDTCFSAWLRSMVVSQPLLKLQVVLNVFWWWKLEGIPLQFSTDCGLETTQLYRLVNALQYLNLIALFTNSPILATFTSSIFHPEYDGNELMAHLYMWSMHNISIERQWLKLCLNWGDTAILDYQKGIDEGLYNPQNAQELYVLPTCTWSPNHINWVCSELCQWLWLKYLRQSIAEEMTITNGARMRKDKNKAGPSGMSCDTAFSLPASWGGKDCLLPIEDMGVIREL